MTRAVLLVGHALSAEHTANTLNQIAHALRKTGAGERIETAILQERPTLETALETCLEQGVKELIVLPCSVETDPELASRVDAVGRAHPDARIQIAPPFGPDPRLLDILKDRIGQAVTGLQTAAGIPILRIEGQVSTPLALTYEDIQNTAGQIADVGRLAPGRRGQGVWVRSLLDRAGIRPGAAYAVFHASDGGFSARVALDIAAEQAFLVYQIDGHPLPPGQGGPLRLLIPDGDDRCANVKNVLRIELTDGEPPRS